MLTEQNNRSPTAGIEIEAKKAYGLSLQITPIHLHINILTP